MPETPTASEAMAAAVSGWRQAVDIIAAQQRALDWCVAQFGISVLPKDETIAREYVERVLSAQKTGRDYLNAMRQTGANE